MVHLHCTHLTALSCLEGLDPANVIRPFTPYYVMRVGQLPLIPYYKPGMPASPRSWGAAPPKATPSCLPTTAPW